MSKHIGNVVDPWSVLDGRGMRSLVFLFHSAPWLPNRFYDEAVSNQRKFMGTIWNTYASHVPYAEIDGFTRK